MPELKNKIQFHLTLLHRVENGQVINYTAESVLNRFNGTHLIGAFKREKDGIEYYCLNKLSVKVLNNGRAEIFSNAGFYLKEVGFNNNIVSN